MTNKLEWFCENVEKLTAEEWRIIFSHIAKAAKSEKRSRNAGLSAADSVWFLSNFKAAIFLAGEHHENFN